MSSRKENHFIADFFAGGLSAIVSKSAMAPVDRYFELRIEIYVYIHTNIT